MSAVVEGDGRVFFCSVTYVKNYAILRGFFSFTSATIMNEDLDNMNSNERRPTRKRQRDNGSQTDEESIVDSGHCCDASMNMQRMEAKIDQLLALLPEFEALKTRLTEVELENKELRNTLDFNGRELAELKATVAYTCSQIAVNREDQKKLKAEVHKQKCRNIKLEGYTRRENIKIFNLPEIRGETPSHTEELVRSMFEEKMNISKEDVDDIQFERVHRLPTRKNSVNPAKPRPIIAKFSFYQDKQFVWSSVKNLKNTGIGLSNDYPKEIDDIHGKLYPVLKNAKLEKQQAFFKVDKLIINGQVYRGKETENLPYYGEIMSSAYADGEL